MNPNIPENNAENSENALHMVEETPQTEETPLTDAPEPTSTTSETSAETDKLAADLAAMKDKYLRLMAEFDNFKRRSARERIEFSRTAASGIIVDLLPVLDDFERAFKSAGDANVKGFELIYNKLKHILDAQGLKAMESIGNDFDPDLHEAVTEFPAPSDNLRGKVIDEVECGYYLHEKIIRHAKVIVGK
ncbi:MAG TPA: nucleotide exchange factor GrpE [Chitinophagales bacterium]|mgnify:CR=1 FL=1|jgi:molecular chaperone GrpE|nr:nucleotide exchange factor GrpE [Chitinophagales bacterium]HNL08233.1 nucleotide exchange factor GrpE [Chitinophagales bacterium]